MPDDYLQQGYVLRPVKYDKIQARTGISTYEGLYIKDKKWSYELEERAVWDRNNYDSALWKIAEDKVYLKVGIKAVIFGCIAQEDKHYLEALKAIKAYNETHKKKIAVKKLTMRDDKFQFVQERDFDYLNEIKLRDKGEI